MSSKKTIDTKEDGKSASVAQLRFPEFRGQALRETLLGEVTEESVKRNGGKHSIASVMGVTKAEGIVPMEVRLIAADIARYKLVENDWFAYNPMRLNIGSIARWKGEKEILVSPDYVVFKCLTEDESGIDPEYLDQFRRTKAWEGFVTQGGDGSVRVRIYYEDIARLQLALPSTAEQQKIAECLSSVDELLSAQERKVRALKSHKKGLMQQLFPCEGETQPRLRFPEFRTAEAWNVKSFGELFAIGNGRDYKHLEPGDVPVYGSGGYMRSVSDFLYEGESVCIGRKGTINNPMFLSGRFWTVDTLFYTHSFKGCLPKFILAVFQQIDWLTHNEAGGIPSLSKANIEKIETAIPSPAEQQRIAECLSSVDEAISAQARKVDALKTHKKWLMQQLFPSSEEAEA